MAKESKFKTGDIVRLKSGGPSMTVESVSEVNGRIWCQWFAGNRLNAGEFNSDSIDFEDELDPLQKLKRGGK
jgi:uncharacterized protein YodC (DUF2158 family)